MQRYNFFYPLPANSHEIHEAKRLQNYKENG